MKTLHWIGIMTVAVVGVALGMNFFALDPVKKSLTESKTKNTLCDSISSDQMSQILVLKEEAKETEETLTARATRITELSTEIDTIKAKALLADSLATVNAELQAQVAALAAASKAKPASGKKGGSAATATTATTVVKASKGKPVTDDVNKTFTYLASDSAAVVGLAPTGYTLVKKPR